MNAIRLITIGLLGLSLSTAGVLAQTAAEREREARERDDRNDDRARTARDVQSPSALVYAKDVIGQTVVNSEGKEIGHIAELIMDPRDGSIQYAVISVGRGFLGIGDKSVAMPWDDLHLSATQKGYLLDVDKDTLAKAPTFDQANPRYDEMDRDRDRYYGTERRQALREDQDTYVGTLESIDRDNNTITVRKALISHKFMLDNASRIPTDRLKVGQRVEVVYTTREDAKVAQHVDVLPDEDRKW